VMALLFLTASASRLGQKRQSEPFSRAKIIIEFNSTANEGVGDVGVQVLLDGEPWRRLRSKARQAQILEINQQESKSRALPSCFLKVPDRRWTRSRSPISWPGSRMENTNSRGKQSMDKR
jgi:hypothetical protein